VYGYRQGKSDTPLTALQSRTGITFDLKFDGGGIRKKNVAFSRNLADHSLQSHHALACVVNTTAQSVDEVADTK
jgi:hypothetical protein